MESKIEIYQSPDGETTIDVMFEQDTVLLTNAQLVTLFDSSKANISEHIKHIFLSGELDEVEITAKLTTWFRFSLTKLFRCQLTSIFFF